MRRHSSLGGEAAEDAHGVCVFENANDGYRLDLFEHLFEHVHDG